MRCRNLQRRHRDAGAGAGTARQRAGSRDRPRPVDHHRAPAAHRARPAAADRDLQDHRQPRAHRRRGGAHRAHRAAPAELRRVQPHAAAGVGPVVRGGAGHASVAQGARRVRPPGHRSGARGAQARRPDRPRVRRPDAQAHHLHDGRSAHHLGQHRPGVRRQGDRTGRRPRQEPGRGDHLHRQGRRREAQLAETVESLVR